MKSPVLISINLWTAVSNLFLKVYGLNSPALGIEISGLEGLEPKSCGLPV